MHSHKVWVLAVMFLISVSYAMSAWADNEDPFDSGKSVEVTASTKSDLSKLAKYKPTDIDDKVKDGKYPVDGTVQGDNLRVREWPWGPVMGQYNTGHPLKVIGESGEFYRVEIDGKIGYMHKNYVSIPDKEASRVEPYYPGNTASGGYLPKKDGVQQSRDSAAGKPPKGSSAVEAGNLASYKGGKLPPDQFIALFGPVARESMKTTGIPASVTLAQAILETGWGGSSIGDAKNLFGIKGTGPAGTIRVNTQECYDGSSYVTIKDGFRKYYTWQQSIDDHAKLLQSSRYAGALNRFKQNHNADEYARGIHQAGYATSPVYSNSLINLMKQYNLYKWDI